MILDETTLRKLNALTLVAERVRAGRIRGDRRSSKRGASIEFADFRNYVPGDDLRRLDWNIYARLDRPFIRLFEDEEDLAIYLLLDGSRSMDWGEGDENKFVYAIRLAAALGSIALGGGDPVRFELLAGDPAGSTFGPARGGMQTMRYLERLSGLSAAGETALDAALTGFAMARRRPGLVFLVSDLLDPQGFRDGLNRMLGRGHQAVVIHVLAPDELDPQLTGDLKLIDREFGTSQEVTLDPAVLGSYQRHLETWLGETEAFCRGRGAGYVRAATGQPWDRFILRELRAEGVVR
ncbi:MAG TPA: DUF58 domain-containing protein [Anaerolineales bacterium]|nr:DUF58 domain-containing protein [Anaerolineales bacterium]